MDVLVVIIEMAICCSEVRLYYWVFQLVPAASPPTFVPFLLAFLILGPLGTSNGSYIEDENQYESESEVAGWLSVNSCCFNCLLQTAGLIY